MKMMIGHEYFRVEKKKKITPKKFFRSIFPNFSARHDGRRDKCCLTNEIQVIKTTILKMTKGNWSLISWSRRVAAAPSSQMRRYHLSNGPWTVTPTSGCSAAWTLLWGGEAGGVEPKPIKIAGVKKLVANISHFHVAHLLRIQCTKTPIFLMWNKVPFKGCDVDLLELSLGSFEVIHYTNCWVDSLAQKWRNKEQKQCKKETGKKNRRKQIVIRRCSTIDDYQLDLFSTRAPPRQIQRNHSN